MDLSDYNNCLQAIKNLRYEEQDHWNIFDDLYYTKVSNFHALNSCRSNGLTNMLETGLPSQEREEALKGNNYDINYTQHEIENLISRFDELGQMMGDDITKIKFNSLIGNPRRYLHTSNNNDFFLNFDDLYHVYSAWQLKRFFEYLRLDSPSIILEIGGGYGNLADKLKSLYPYTKYVIVDLPEVLLLQHYYISQNNPNAKITNLLSPDCSLDEETDGFDFLLVPYGEHEKLNFNFDLIISTRSLGEMPKKVLHNYIAWTEKTINSNGILYTTNRYVFTKSTDQNKIRDYPFDEFWNVIVSQPQWLQTHLHEFLLQRSINVSNVPIEILLKSFPISTPPPGPIMQKIQTQSEWIKHQQ